MKKQYNPNAIALSELEISRAQAISEAHFQRFYGDSDNLLKEQIQEFNQQTFQEFHSRFLSYQIINAPENTIEDLFTISRLWTDSYRYDALFLCKDYVTNDHPILSAIDFPFISKKDLYASFGNIEATNMVKLNRESLISHCLLHLRTKFLSTLSPNFYLQYINNTQAKSKRDRVSPEFMKSETATMADRSIRNSIEKKMQGVFGYGPAVWNAIIKVTSPKKNGLQLPNYAALTGTTPIQINKTAKKVTVYESMLPLIRLLSPDYPILTFDQWCEREENDPHLPTYRNQYLIRRIQMFDRSGILFK
ncbi:MAG: hypothetical protein O2951_18625 [Bacteroidetes bacterium]|nr:hypothetical protein [Bacteroidota bacterium]